MHATLALAWVVLLSGAAEPDPPAASSPTPFPHPLITEVLYAVPNATEGDANLDGVRHASGDEFVELFNPHDKPIQLFGYSLSDRNPEGKGQFKFTFPAFELPPGAVAVVFNGFEAAWSEVGPVGNKDAAPEGANEDFHGASVFTAAAASARSSLANAGDFVLLSDPSNQPVQCVHWGKFTEKMPDALLIEAAPTTAKGSVQRESLTGQFKVHPVKKEEANTAFSPGDFKMGTATETKPATSEPASTGSTK